LLINDLFAMLYIVQFLFEIASRDYQKKCDIRSSYNCIYTFDL